ncbi:MAG TPA: hypothetical protein VFB66_16890 [Tepidisphaeraceae bacterium]|nr:hypothetical protein [Tepidisphaeraceae bacterium]
MTEHDYMPAAASLYNATSGELVVNLYRQPAPAALVTLPAGYQGVVKIALRWTRYKDGMPVPAPEYPVGQRLFLFPLDSPDGLTWFPWSPLIQQAMGERCHAIYDDGTPIPTTRRGNPQSVAFRPLRSPMGGAGFGLVYLFYVGTLEEYEPLAREASFRNPGADQMDWIKRFGIRSDVPSHRNGG